MNKDIKTLIEREACEHWSQSNYKEVAEKAHSGNDMCKTSAMARKVSNSSFQSGAHFALSLFKWRKVSEELPESNKNLIIETDPMLKTQPVLIKTVGGGLFVDYRVNTIHENIDGRVNFWNWTKFNNNQVSEWMPIPQID